MTERKPYGIGSAGRTFAAAVSRLAEAMEFAELQPHAYAPSPAHMGDCAICGHLQGSAIHSPFRRTPGEKAQEERK